MQPANKRDRLVLNEQKLLKILEELLRDHGWHIQHFNLSPRRPDLIAERGNLAYSVELKRVSEGRSDRLIPAWSQAYLQARNSVHSNADPHLKPMAIVAAPRVAERAAEQLIRFAQEFAPEAAVGVIDNHGLRRFRGPGLENLDSDPADNEIIASSVPRPSSLFSDLNQWMLKLLLAPEIPENLLSAPRLRYRNASELAGHAGVSVMSAHRFLELLSIQGYLDPSSKFIQLIGCSRLMQQWLAAPNYVSEIRLKFLLNVDVQLEVRKLVRGHHDRCIALFAAADALGVGFVHGALPHVYASRISSQQILEMRHVRVADDHEPADFLLRQPKAEQSVFRAAVVVDDVPISDIIQVWIDVSNHPARGQEQADLIARRYLAYIL